MSPPTRRLAIPPRIDPDRAARVRSLATRGLNLSGIADVAGISRSTVKRILSNAYADGSVPRRLHPGRPSIFHQPTTLRLLHQRREEGRSIPQLAADFHSSVSAVTRALHRLP